MSSAYNVKKDEQAYCLTMIGDHGEVKLVVLDGEPQLKIGLGGKYVYLPVPAEFRETALQVEAAEDEKLKEY